MSEVENIYHEICALLSKQSYKKSRNRLEAEKAIQLIEKYSLVGFSHYFRGIVHFPDLLKIFLKIHTEAGYQIEDENLSCMISRCIESSDENFSLNDRKDSMKYIFVYTDMRKIGLKLLCGKYVLNEELCKYAKDNNIYDEYLENNTLPYSYETTFEKEISGKYSGYRDSYHSLLYGNQRHLHGLIKRWKEWTDDCTADAARDFFDVVECPLEIVIGKVQLKLEKMIRLTSDNPQINVSAIN